VGGLGLDLANSVGRKTMNASERFYHTYQHSCPDTWLTQLRDQARDSFTSQGLPTSKLEDWKYTRLKHIEQLEFSHAELSATPLSLEQKNSLPHCPGGYQLVFVNGHYTEELSDVPLAKDFIICSFAKALEQHTNKVQSTLGQITNHKDQPFAALNTMFMNDGVFLWLPKNTHIQHPIHCLFITSATDKSTVIYPRLLVILEDNAKATLLEHYLTITHPQAVEVNPCFTNAVTEILLGASAQMNHYRLQQESVNNSYIAGLHVMQQQASRFNSHSFCLGATLARDDIHITLAGKKATCSLLGAYCSGDQQHHEQHLKIDHVAPDCSSKTLYKGVIQDNSRAVFNGNIVVHPKAQKSNAHLINRNLLLSAKGHVDTKPELQIYADDVICSHGATVGQLDNTALFYLQSRGITRQAAEALLVSAFMSEIFVSIEQPEIKKLMCSPVLDQLNMLIEKSRPQQEELIQCH